MNRLKSLWFYWQNFWFTELNAKILQLYTRIFGGVLFGLYTVRFWNLDFYDSRSLIPNGEELDLFDSLVRPLWSWHWWPDSWTLFFQILFLSICLLMAFGKSRRPVVFVAWLIHMGFMHRNWAAGMGVDTMVTVFLFYLSFVDTRAREGGDLLSRAMIRMSQVHLGVIYFYTGVEKFRGASWWEGTALWTTLSNPQMTLIDLSWLHHFPTFIGLLSHSTVLFELMFLPLVFLKPSRNFILLVGVMFHLGIAVFLGLWGFSAVMLTQYLLQCDRYVVRNGASQ